MADDAQPLLERLRQVELQIEEALRRMPPHSIKPPEVMDLLVLEDERDMLLKKIGALR